MKRGWLVAGACGIVGAIVAWRCLSIVPQHRSREPNLIPVEQALVRGELQNAHELLDGLEGNKTQHGKFLRAALAVAEADPAARRWLEELPDDPAVEVLRRLSRELPMTEARLLRAWRDAGKPNLSQSRFLPKRDIVIARPLRVEPSASVVERFLGSLSSRLDTPDGSPMVKEINFPPELVALAAEVATREGAIEPRMLAAEMVQIATGDTTPWRSLANDIPGDHLYGQLRLLSVERPNPVTESTILRLERIATATTTYDWGFQALYQHVRDVLEPQCGPVEARARAHTTALFARSLHESQLFDALLKAPIGPSLHGRRCKALHRVAFTIATSQVLLDRMAGEALLLDVAESCHTETTEAAEQRRTESWRFYEEVVHPFERMQWPLPRRPGDIDALVEDEIAYFERRERASH